MYLHHLSSLHLLLYPSCHPLSPSLLWLLFPCWDHLDFFTFKSFRLTTRQLFKGSFHGKTNFSSLQSLTVGLFFNWWWGYMWFFFHTLWNVSWCHCLGLAHAIVLLRSHWPSFSVMYRRQSHSMGTGILAIVLFLLSLPQMPSKS